MVGSICPSEDLFTRYVKTVVADEVNPSNKKTRKRTARGGRNTLICARVLFLYADYSRESMYSIDVSRIPNISLTNLVESSISGAFVAFKMRSLFEPDVNVPHFQRA